MSILFWVFVAHTLIWAISAAMTNLFSPDIWDETTLKEKIMWYVFAERQLYRGIYCLIKYRREVWGTFVSNWRKKRGIDDD